jgi:uncharacterized membrane protein
MVIFLTRIVNSVEINASPERVFSIVSDFERIPEWQPEFKKVWYTSEEKRKVGSSLRANAAVGGFKLDLGVTVTEWVENKRMAWRTTMGNASGSGSITLEPAGAATKYTEVTEYSMPYSVLGKLIDRVRIRKAMERSYQAAIKNKKALAEK